MKTIGKIAALAMTLAMALALTACGGSGSSSSAASSASASASSASASASSSASSEFEIGKAEADTYTNEFFGVQFVLPEGYEFKDDAFLADLNKSVGETINDEAVTKALENGTAFFDMAAIGPENDNVNVVIEYAGTPAAKAIDAATYVEYAKDPIAKQLEGSGATVSNIEVTTFKNAAGDEFPALKLQLEMNGAQLNEEVLVLKSGDYFMSITATASAEANLEKMLNNISLL